MESRWRSPAVASAIVRVRRRRGMRLKMRHIEGERMSYSPVLDRNRSLLDDAVDAEAVAHHRSLDREPPRVPNKTSTTTRRPCSSSTRPQPSWSRICGSRRWPGDCPLPAPEDGGRARLPSSVRTEGCPSGLRSATGNRVCAERCIEGSNPSPSALSRKPAACGLSCRKCCGTMRDFWRSGRVAEGGALLRR